MTVETTQGAFFASLKRNNAKIREDRAQAISEDAEIHFRREVEDIEMKISRLKRDRDNMLDMSPENATSLVLASDFNAQAFVQKDIELGIKIRNEEIKLEVARARYNALFTSETTEVK